MKIGLYEALLCLPERECQRMPLAFGDEFPLRLKELARDGHHSYIINEDFSRWESKESQASY